MSNTETITLEDNDFKYDVAFSFCAEDEGIALELDDLIKERFSTFLYSKKQEKLAGSNGEEAFNKVFGQDARIVIVLYRDKWGETPFTRFEGTAIRNRGFEEGYDFTLFIPMDKSALPRWVPKNRLYLDFERYGSEAARAVIEAKIQEAGAEPKEESIEELAFRTEREVQFEKFRKHFLSYSEDAVRAANEEAESLFELVKEKVESLKKLNLKVGLPASDYDKRYLERRYNNTVLAIDWQSGRAANILEGSGLSLEVWTGTPPRNNRSRYCDFLDMDSKPSKIDSRSFNFDIDRNRIVGWREEKRFQAR